MKRPSVGDLHGYLTGRKKLKQEGMEDTYDTQPQEASYTVVEGDTVESVAAFNGISAESLLQRNGLGIGASLTAGQVLYIPIPT